MQRIALIVFRMLFSVIALIIQMGWYAKPKHQDYHKAYQILRKKAEKAVKAANVELKIKGIENIPKEDGFIFYPNHQGLFDVLVFLVSCSRPFAFVIKKESSNIIMLKQIIGAIGSIPMDRTDLKQSMQVINEVAERVKQGENFIIFPEGTRSRNGNKLLDFKAGSFKAATKAKCPIVPCALIDSYKPFDEKGIKKKTVKLIYLPAISYDTYGNMRTQDLAQMVKSQIEKAIYENENNELN